jgi:hypothetical protein
MRADRTAPEVCRNAAMTSTPLRPLPTPVRLHAGDQLFRARGGDDDAAPAFQQGPHRGADLGIVVDNTDAEQLQRAHLRICRDAMGHASTTSITACCRTQLMPSSWSTTAGLYRDASLGLDVVGVSRVQLIDAVPVREHSTSGDTTWLLDLGSNQGPTD